MPRCLVIDWDQDRCHLLAGNVTRSGMRIEHALSWAQDEVFDPAQGEEAGKKLKEFLKTSGVAPAPLLICLPKQRALFKDLRIPSVPADEQPALVRFQAAKELLESPEEIVLDYAEMARSAAETQVLVTAVRKGLLAAYQALAKGANLKLLAVTPRPFVVADLLARSREIDPIPSGGPPDWSAVLVLGQSWAELTILSGSTVRFARSLANDDTLESEVRRSLVMFATQPQGQPVKVLYLFGQGATLQVQERLEKTLHIAVTRPRVVSEDDAAAGSVECACAAGMLEAFGREKLAVNFVKPKEPKPPAESKRRMFVLLGGLAFALLAGLWFVGQQMLLDTRNQIARLKDEKKKVEDDLKKVDHERVNLDAFDEWEQGTIPWADELAEISRGFPYQPAGFHLTRLDGAVLARRNPKEKEKYQAHITLIGKDRNPVGGQRNELTAALEEHFQVLPDKTQKENFTIQLDLTRDKGERGEKFVSGEGK